MFGDFLSKTFKTVDNATSIPFDMARDTVEAFDSDTDNNGFKHTRKKFQKIFNDEDE